MRTRDGFVLLLVLGLTSGTAHAALTGFQIVSADTPLSGGNEKELTVSCPAGKIVWGAGWGAISDSGSVLDGTVTHSMPALDGASWTVRASATATNWKLRVSITCSDASGVSGYEVVSGDETSQPAAYCPLGKYLVGAGWSATDASGGWVGTRNWLSLMQVEPEPFFGDNWSSWPSSGNSGDGLTTQFRIICVDREGFAAYERPLFRTIEDTRRTKEIYPQCGEGKQALSIGWFGGEPSCPSCGQYPVRQTYALPDADGRKWRLRVTDGLFATHPAWRLEAQLVCVETDTPRPACSETLADMQFASAGPTSWPGACWRPFDTPTNPFVRPIPESAKENQVHSNSANIVSQMLAGGRPGELLGYLNGHAGEPTYYSQSTDPQYVIRCRNDPFLAPDGHCLAIEGKTVRVPSWALPENGFASTATVDGHDGHMTIIDRAEGVQYDLWQVQTAPLPASPAAGGALPELVVSAGNRIALNSSGLYAVGQQTTTSFGVGRNATAGYFAGQLGKIRLEELEAGEINHALFMLAVCQNTFENGNGVVYPAAGPGGRKCTGSFAGLNANAPAMGAHFFYSRTPEEIDSLVRADGSPLPLWKRAILKALSRYGAYVGDNAGTWGFDQEASYQYSSATNGARRWYDYGQSQGWGLWVGPDGQTGTGDDRYYGRLYDLVGAGGALPGDVEDRAIINFEAYLKVLKFCVSQGTCS